ncbi:amino acid ABC transporter permease [Skermanella stibiiresistens SB22]|uniref:Amino acid ABC transporter permease n=1 Tax=Skermanella stibiiresistens SB22 TaxID=1385369 RepID=W9H6H5_9PROT|nr:urea ABC transporter permease subunit UrtC [Skermanella stibiiresistens]EWY41614.1 amino acid ABC transporter permease [Skermanella stibiiresistens SB22]
MSGLDDVLIGPRRPAPRRGTAPMVAAVLALLGVGVLAAGAGGAGPSAYVLNLIGQIATFGMLAVALDLIWGFAGVLSLGHGLFFAIGGYLVAMHMVKVTFLATGTPPDFMLFMGWDRLPFYYAGLESFAYTSVLVVVVAGLAAFAIGYTAFRSRVAGVYFAIITQAFVYVAMLLMFRNDTGFGGNNGMTGFTEILGQPLADRRTVAWLSGASILAAALTLGGSALLTGSRFGHMLIAIRDDEARLRFLGHDTLWIKLTVWCLSAVLAAIAGMLYVPQVGIINPRVLAPDLSIEIAVWVAIGGRGTLTGAFLGAVLVSALKFLLTAVAPDLWPFILSGLVLVVVVLLPNGLLDIRAVLASRQRRGTP